MTIDERKQERKMLEYKLLSSILSRGVNAFTVLAKINFTEDCIEDVQARALFQSMKMYYDNGEQLAINALPNPEFVSKLMSLEIEKEAVKPLAESIWDMKVAKEIESLFLRAGEFLHHDNKKIFTMMNDFIEEFENVMYPKDKVSTANDCDAEARAYQEDEGAIGIPAPVDGINDTLGNGELIMICARPSIGKTAMMTSMTAVFCKEKTLQNVLLFSLEQTRLQIYNRILSNLTNIAHGIIKNKNMSKGQRDKYYKYSGALKKKGNLYICDADPDTASLEYIIAVARSKKREGKLDIIFIDYAQLMISRKKTHNRVEELGYISRRLKGLAKELNIPVVLLAQLNREAENKKKGESTLPRIGDIKGSGSFEQDADQIYLLHRERNDDRILVIHAKHRDGKAGGKEWVDYKTHLNRIGGEK